jgi:hypothetical protein
MIGRLRELWTWLLAPWRQARGRDEWDLDMLGAVYRLQVRVDALEHRISRRPGNE